MSLNFINRLPKTLGFRLTLLYSAIFIVSSALVLVISYAFLTAMVRDNQKLIRSKLNKYVRLAENGGIPAVLRAAKAPRNDFFVRVVGPDNTTVFMTRSGAWKVFDLQAVEERAVDTGWQYFPSTKDSDILEVASAILPNGYALQVGNDVEDRKEILEDFRETTVAVMTPMILIGLIGGGLMSFRATRPIRHLIHTAQSIVDTGSVNARVTTGTRSGELNDLARLFNQMLQRIEVLIKGMRDALDNVAHELRTPMTRLRCIAENGLQEASPQAQREALADCLEESQRVLTLLNALMDISEAQTGAMRLNLEALRVSELIDEIVELYRPFAEDSGIEVSVNCPENIHVLADRNRMRQVVANLLDNAIKYTDAGGRVAVDASEQDDQVVLHVRDNGPGIPPAEISKIWDRLHRGDASRSKPGLGLGLSLVAAIVHAHKGRIGVHSTPGIGTTFTLYMQPASVEAPALAPAANLSEI